MIGVGSGLYVYADGEYSETFDFFTLNPLQVGTTTPFKAELSGNKLTLSADTFNGVLVEVWEKISEAEDELTGNWVITGRKRDDQISRYTPGVRRTIKILSGGRFNGSCSTLKPKNSQALEGELTPPKTGNTPKTSPFFQGIIQELELVWDLNSKSSMESGIIVD